MPSRTNRRGPSRLRNNGGVDKDLTVADWQQRVAFNADGLVPAIVQEETSRDVLMLAWMDAEALRRTLETGRATYWSRSRRTHWVKGETSGHHQHVREVRADCDGDTVLVVVAQTGAACHTGADTCFDGVPLSLSVPAGG
jgi:phosphoribosyl-AMP cyclohydrolase